MSQAQREEVGHRAFGQWMDTWMLFRKVAGAGLGVDCMGEEDAGRGIRKLQRWSEEAIRGRMH